MGDSGVSPDRGVSGTPPQHCRGGTASWVDCFCANDFEPGSMIGYTITVPRPKGPTSDLEIQTNNLPQSNLDWGKYKFESLGHNFP